MESDDDTAHPTLAWDTTCDESSAYVMLGGYLKNLYPNATFILTNKRERINDDGDVVTIHDVEYLDIETQRGIDTQGYVHVWKE